MEARRGVNAPKSIVDSVRNAPFAWAAALAVAALPFVVVGLKSPARPVVQAAAGDAAAARRESTVSDWFSGADNPFLTEEQSRERRVRASLSRVEEVLRRRPDVREVTILASATGQPSAVVSIAMRDGVVPVQLVDAAGTLLGAAVPGLRAEDVTVIDETSGIRAKACALGSSGSDDGRKALAGAQVDVGVRAGKPPAREVVVQAAAPDAASWPWWLWAGGIGGALLIAGVTCLWRSRTPSGEAIEIASDEDAIAGTLAMALHRGVAEQGALITTALVERLEQGAPPNEVAQLLLSLEPWAAERVLKGMPPDALAKVEQALRDPAHDAPIESVRALAEAVLSVRSAA
jgi:flagellar biosynthesis/type III secretory pathway M-ring protein FliF/YscJ